MFEKESRKCVLSGFGEGYPEALCSTPSFSWYCEEKAGRQSKYRLRIDDTKGNTVWDSGWVVSEQSDNVIYGGLPLDYDSDYVAQVIVEDDEGQQVESDKEYFSTGLSENMWLAKWMRPSHLGAQSPLVRKVFTAKKEVVRAKLYICGLGYQESYINGSKVGKDVLSPTWTDYRKRVCYNTYDIKPFICTGENVLGIQLG